LLPSSKRTAPPRGLRSAPGLLNNCEIRDSGVMRGLLEIGFSTKVSRGGGYMADLI
jgi:hypothetical protein